MSTSSQKLSRQPFPKAALFAFSIIALALFGAAGGSALGLSLLFILAGSSLLVAPPLKTPPPAWCVLGGVWFLWCLVAFIPGTRFFSGGWRQNMESLHGLPLTSPLTVQPWITLEQSFFLLLALGLFIYWCAHAPDAKTRHLLLRTLAGGLTFFATLVAILYFTGLTLPGWSSPTKLGPFENRNQLSTVLALSLLLLLALALNDWKKHRLWSVFWILGGALTFYLLILNFSRAGVILFFCGGMAWAFFNLGLSRQMGRLAMAFLIMVLMLCAFVIYGGKTLERFEQLTTASTFISKESQGRAAIHQDALAMISDQPWAGVGLGNFQSVFPQYLNAFKPEALIRHPESDWLWLGAEMGIPSLLLALALILCWLLATLPLKSGSDKFLRSACLVMGLVVLANGFIDVPLHRVGSLLPSLFIASLAIVNTNWSVAGLVSKRIFQLMGGLLVVWGIISLGELATFWSKPGSTAAITALGTSKETALLKTDQALLSNSLNWQLYFRRAALTLGTGDVVGARDDFRRARFLEPILANLPLQESLIWMPVRPDLAIAAVSDMLSRSNFDVGTKYQTLEKEAQRLGQTEFLEQLSALARDRPDLEQFYLETAGEEDFDAWLNDQEKALRASQNQWFWPLVKKRKTDTYLLEWVEQRPQWLRAHSRIFADMWVAQGNYAKAFQLMQNYTPPAIIPKYENMDTKTQELMRQRFIINSSDFAAAYSLIQEDINQRNDLAALDKINRVLLDARAPSYFYYLAATALGRQKEWVKAYQALRNYDDARTLSKP